MTSRERVRAAINHKEPDKIAIDCGGMHSSGVSGMTYNTLKKHLGIAGGNTRIYDVNQQLVIPEQWYLDRFQIDVVDLSRAFSRDSDWVDWPLRDGSAAQFPAWVPHEKRGDSWVAMNESGDVIASMGPNAFYFDQEYYPYYQQSKEDFSDLRDALARISWTGFPDPMTKHSGEPDYFEKVRAAAKKLHDETEYSIMVNDMSIAFEPGQWLYRNDEFFMKMIAEPDEVKRLFDALVDLQLQRLEPLLKAVDGYADVIVFSDDLGMQDAPLVSPDMYKELIFPYHRKVFRYVKEHSGLKTFIHSCGAIADMLPHLIDAGLDIVNPVQTQSAGMEPEKLKREFGKDLVFWGGGIDTQHSLNDKTPDEVKDQVRRNCEILMKDGGFVFTPIHNMLPGIPPENIVALYEAANEIAY